MRTLIILLRKEFILFRKNKFLPKVAFIFPCLVILIIPLVTTMDVRHVGVAVINHDNTQLSRNIISDLSATSYFSVQTAESYEKAINLIECGKCDVILDIPTDFQKSLSTNAPKVPHISANGVNGLKGSLGSRYVSQSVMNTVTSYLGIEMPDLISIQYLYNPTLEYRNNMIPALMIMLLLMICGFLPALNLVSEKETGTIEQMNVTPIKTPIFVLSKVIPYWVIGLIDISLAMLIAKLVYGLSPTGSLCIIYLASILFIFVMSGLGIVIANKSMNMLQSMFLMFFLIMILNLMSGLLTPISSMPDWAQKITYALPPRYFIEIMRMAYLKDASFDGLQFSFIMLAVFAVFMNVLAALTYKKQA